ncbi:mycothiol synthase [Pseudonocardia sp. CNS-139]|nr:mycothiol synthase [Pseudonocardia sp. CNS-139]
MSELSWRAELTDAEAAEVAALAAAAAALDGVAPLGDDVFRHLRDAAADHVLVRAADGALAGFAHLEKGSDGGSAELVVHPDHRRAGLGRALVAALLARTQPLRVWAHGNLPAAAALAARLGFAPVRELRRMRRDLTDPVPEPVLAPGVRIRSFVVGADEAEFLRVNNAAFDWHPEQGGWTVADVRQREGEPWFDPDGFLLAVDADDRLLGFHWTKVHAETPPMGEVYVLGVDPAAQGTRLGKALTLAGLRHLRNRGLDRVMLYVEADNSPAVRLYQGLGFTLWDADVSYER